MKTIEGLTHVHVLNSNQLKHIKSGNAPDCETGQVLIATTGECVTEEQPIEGMLMTNDCINGLP